MSFIQIVEYETDKAAEIDTKMREAMDVRTESGFTRLEHTQDRDNPRHYMTIVEFPSYEAAMANSQRPETDAMAKDLAALCTSGPSFTNLDVKLDLP
jgi:quinol monooxygenase YgiN